MVCDILSASVGRCMKNNTWALASGEWKITDSLQDCERPGQLGVLQPAPEYSIPCCVIPRKMEWLLTKGTLSQAFLLLHLIWGILKTTHLVWTTHFLTHSTFFGQNYSIVKGIIHILCFTVNKDISVLRAPSLIVSHSSLLKRLVVGPSMTTSDFENWSI